MAVPHAVLASGWIPFVIVIVLAFIFAWIYVRYFQHHELSSVSCTLISILALFVTLTTVAIVPVDVFLVSFMKDSNGAFKSWAKDSDARESIQNALTYVYYTLYGIIAFNVFLLLPFMYFFFEEKDDDVSTSARFCSAFKFTLIFVLIALVILIVGAFVPLHPPPSNISSISDKMLYLREELKVYTHGEQCISIMVGVLSLFGITLAAFYMGYGMSALPCKMLSICCRVGLKNEEEERPTSGLSQRERDEERARMLRGKANSGKSLTRWERNQLRRIEENERLRRRIERQQQHSSRNICGKIALLLRPFKFVFGLIFLLISLLIITSVIITSIDKTMHSLGYRYGYALPKPKIFNPLNAVLVYFQKVFPLDYILFLGIVLFLLLSSMSGIKRIGLWCCCIHIYKIRPYRTMPQALLMMVFMLMLIVLAMNVLLFAIAPQYVTFGSQHFMGNSTVNGSLQLTVCSTESPPDECTMTRMAILLNKLFYKAWFFGAYYYYAQWTLIGVFFIGLLVSLVKCREPDDFDPEMDDMDSDEELIT